MRYLGWVLMAFLALACLLLRFIQRASGGACDWLLDHEWWFERFMAQKAGSPRG